MILSKNIILITAGDPASISTEITIKAIKTKKINENINVIVVTDPNLIEESKYLFESNIKINQIKDKINFTDYKKNCINVIPIQLTNKVKWGKPDQKNFSFVKCSIITAIDTYINSSLCNCN